MTQKRKQVTVNVMNQYWKGALSFVAVFIVIAGFGAVSTVSAATFRAGSEYTLAGNATVADNLYTAARDLVVVGEVQKDLLAAGASVVVQGKVGADAAIAGGSVDVRGPVVGDVRLVGGQLSLEGQVGGDFVAAGGTVVVKPNTRIEGDTVIFGDRVVLDGTFARGVTVRARSIEVRGTIKGPFDASAGESLAIYDTAHIEKGLTYTASNEAVISEHASVQGTTTFNKSESVAARGVGPAFVSVFGILGFLGFLSLTLCTALLALVFPRFCHTIVSRAIGDSKKTIAVGFLVSIALPILIIALLVTIIGFVLSLLTGLALIVLIVMGKLLTGVLAGALLAQWRTKEIKVTWTWALLGSVVVYLISLIPILGWFVAIMLFFAVAGSLSLLVYENWWRNRRQA